MSLLLSPSDDLVELADPLRESGTKLRSIISLDPDINFLSSLLRLKLVVCGANSARLYLSMTLLLACEHNVGGNCRVEHFNR